MSDRSEYLMVRLSPEEKRGLQVLSDLYFEGNMSLTVRSMISSAVKDNNWFPDSINDMKVVGEQR